MSTTTNPNKALWEKGDFTRIAESMRESGEALVTTLGITDRLEVLDVGCGDGTTALPAARLAANVLGVDIASNLVEAGNARARASASATADSKKEMRPIWASSRITASTSSSASSARCSLRGRLTWQRSSCA
jgi:cyclopropane fatty-acyl-phospholipid synthase-like methyltransferase